MPSSQTKANKKWQAKNKEYSNYLKSRSTARSFVRNKATSADLDELKALITQKELLLSESINES